MQFFYHILCYIYSCTGSLTVSEQYDWACEWMPFLSACQILFKGNQSCAVKTSYPYSKWRPLSGQFQVWWRHLHWKSKSNCKPKFNEIGISASMDDLLYGHPFYKLTTAILEFYFRFRFLPIYRDRRVILYRPTKFHQNRNICGWVITSHRAYRFLKMAAIEQQIYFQIRVQCCHSFAKVKLHLFRLHNLDEIS